MNTRDRIRSIVCLALPALISASVQLAAQVLDPRSYDIGDPAPLVDLYVSATGSDDNSGLTREQPLATIGAAWSRITDLLSTGYRINILPGNLPCEGDCINYFSDRRGSWEHPIIIRALDGPGSAVLLGGLNIADVSHLYLFDLTLKAGGDAPLATNNVLHLDGGDHVLFRGVTFIGPDPAAAPGNFDIQEVFKANQSRHLYIEGCDFSGAYQTGIDLFSVQYGHVIGSRIHAIGDWGMYVKGGSAYLRIEGNEIFDTRLGFQAGEGSNFEVMRSPWIHYEAYDIRFTNNVLHDIPGVPLSVSGGFNILIAYNTLYRIAYDSENGYALLHLVHGSRSCAETSENGPDNADSICGDFLARGGWGVTSQTDGGEWIPNRNVYVFNNLFFNPEPIHSLIAHFGVNTSVKPPEGSNVENPSATDVNVRIRGNLIWNGPEAQLLTVSSTNGGEPGCDQFNLMCNVPQLEEENTINTVRPQLVDPENGNFLPVPGGNVTQAIVYEIVDFEWDEAPASPVVLSGARSNGLTVDFGGNARPARDLPGAYTLGTTQADAPTTPNPLAPFDGETGVSIEPTFQWSAVQGAGTYRLQLSLSPTFTTLTADVTGISGTVIHLADLNTGTTYYWRVQARNRVGESGWSGAIPFTTLGSVMAAPTLISPADGVDDVGSSIPLRWNVASGAQTYVLQVAGEPEFVSPLYRRAGITDTTEGLTGIAPGARYYWRVRGVNGLGVSDWSQVWSFTSAEPDPGTGVDERIARMYPISIHPNPVSGVATVGFSIPSPGRVRIVLMNAVGESMGTVMDGEVEQGEHVARIDAAALPSGAYVCRFEHGGTVVTRPVVVVR